MEPPASTRSPRRVVEGRLSRAAVAAERQIREAARKDAERKSRQDLLLGPSDSISARIIIAERDPDHISLTPSEQEQKD